MRVMVFGKATEGQRKGAAAPPPSSRRSRRWTGSPRSWPRPASWWPRRPQEQRPGQAHRLRWSPAARSSTGRSPRAASWSPASRSGGRRTWTRPWPGRSAAPISRQERDRNPAVLRGGGSGRVHDAEELSAPREGERGSSASPDTVRRGLSPLRPWPTMRCRPQARRTRRKRINIEATFRIERARLIAGLARIVRNVDLAEELAQDALVVALSEWPRTGVPDQSRRLVDGRRQTARHRRASAATRCASASTRRSRGRWTRRRDGAAEAIEAAMDDDSATSCWASIFMACHPTLSPDARAC